MLARVRKRHGGISRRAPDECLCFKLWYIYLFNQLFQALFLSCRQQAQAGQIAIVNDAMYFNALLRTQHAHEISHDVARDTLPRHQHGNAGRIRRDLVRADPAVQLVVYPLLLVQQRHQLAAAVERVARQVSQAGKARNLGNLIQAPGRTALPRDAHQRIVQARHLAAGGADREKQRQRVEGRFLDLDVVALEQLSVRSSTVKPQREMSTVTLVGSSRMSSLLTSSGSRSASSSTRNTPVELICSRSFLRQLQRAREQLVALHHRLLARDVEARDHAVLRAGRGVHVEVLAEQVLVETGSLTWIMLACENADSTLCVLCVA